MKRKYLKVVFYASVFGVAYGSFFYHHYSLTNTVATAPSVKTDVLIEASLLGIDHTHNNQQEVIKYDEPYQMPNMQAIGSKKRVKDKNNTQYNSSFTAVTSNHSILSTSSIEQSDYPQEIRYQQNTKEDTTARRINNISNYIEPSNIAPRQNLLSASSKISNNETLTKTVVEQKVEESDGYEFLPDGSSQQDLFTSQSKNPRVYTIKNYQTANISCTLGYDDSSPHAKLIRGLKGC